MANAEKTARLGLFQAATDAFLDMRAIEGFFVMTTMAMFNNLLTMKWDTVTVDCMHSGWLGNPNLFSPGEEEATSALNNRASSLMGGKTATPDHNTHAIMKMTIASPCWRRLNRPPETTQSCCVSLSPNGTRVPHLAKDTHHKIR